jgi:MYXO-CTERM domain-containing protein
MARFECRRLCLISVLTLLALKTSAQATEIAFDFDGTVTGATAMVNTSAGFAQLPPGVVVGAPVFATLAYDTASLGGTSIPNVLTYPASVFTIDIAGNLWVANSPEIFIGALPFSGVHFMTVSAGNFTASPPPPSVPFPLVNGQFATLSISSSASDFLDGLQLPTAPLDLTLASTAAGNIVANSCECFGTGPGPDANEEIDFSIASMTLAISEPATAALFGAALLVLPWLGRRRRHRD